MKVFWMVIGYGIGSVTTVFLFLLCDWIRERGCPCPVCGGRVVFHSHDYRCTGCLKQWEDWQLFGGK